MTARDGFTQVLRGEWTKLRSVRSTGWCILLGTGLMVLFSLLGAAGSSTTAGDDPGPRYQDQFRFVHQSLAGDGTVVARVLTQQDTGPWARAGIMVKQSPEPGAPYAALMVTPGHGVRLQSNFTTDLAGSAAGTPRWLKLTRSGSSVSGYESADGVTWSPVGTVTVSGLPRTAEAGLFVTSPATGQRVLREGTGTRTGPDWKPSTATFDQVSLVPAAGQPSPTATWRTTDVSGPVQQVDNTTVAGSSSQSGGTFTVTGAGDIAPANPNSGDDDIVRNALAGVFIGLIAIVTLGVLYMTSEFKTHQLRTTFAASPRRSRVLAAKAVVLGGVVFVAGLVASVAAFQLAQPILRGNGYRPPAYPYKSLADPTVLRAVVGTALVLTVLALFALGLGAILRRTAGAIVIVIALVVVPGVLTGLLPLEVEKWVTRLTPLAGLAIQQTRDRYDNWVAPWPGFGVLCAYAAISLGLGFWLLRRRDTT
jgi:hypothetical protein